MLLRRAVVAAAKRGFLFILRLRRWFVCSCLYINKNATLVGGGRRCCIGDRRRPLYRQDKKNVVGPCFVRSEQEVLVLMVIVTLVSKCVLLVFFMLLFFAFGEGL